jgi:hypothetical protein
VVAQEAPEVFGLGFGEFGPGIDEGIIARPGFGGGNEFRGDLLQMDDGGGAWLICGWEWGRWMEGGQALWQKKGEAVPQGAMAFWEKGRWRVSVFGAERRAS